MELSLLSSAAQVAPAFKGAFVIKRFLLGSANVYNLVFALELLLLLISSSFVSNLFWFFLFHPSVQIQTRKRNDSSSVLTIKKLLNTLRVDF